MPTNTETAIFNGAGNGKTTISTGSIILSPGIPSNGGILFDTANAAAYTIGGPKPGDGTITFQGYQNAGTNLIEVSPSVTTNQVINANLVAQSSSLTVVTNNSTFPGQTLTLGGGISSSGGAVILGGSGTTIFTGTVTFPASSGQFINGAGKLVLGGSPKTVPTFQSNTSLEINAPLSVAVFDFAGDMGLNATLSISSPGPGAGFFGTGVVNGGPSGKMIAPLIAADAGSSLTIQAEIAGTNVNFGNDQFATVSAAGTVVLAGANTYTGATTIRAGVVSVSSIGNSGVARNLGAGSTIQLFNAATKATLLYTGTGESSNRSLEIKSAPAAVVDQSGTGLLRLNGAVSGTGPVTLQGSTSGAGEIAGAMADGSSELSLIKAGTGTWTLSGANTFTGRTSIAGGTLALNYDASDTSKLADGAALQIGSGTLALVGSAGTHTESVGSTTLFGGGTITRSGGNSATIALGAITHNFGSSLDISGDTFATTASLNFVGVLPGVFVNGQFAKNSTNAAGGTIVAVADSAYTNVNRLGGTISNSASALVRIVDGGSSGNISMATSGTTSINTLMQSATQGTATVNIGTGNTLRLGSIGTVFLPAGSSPLTFNGGNLIAATELFVNNQSATSEVIVNSIVSGGTSIGKGGQGTLVLSAVNTYSGQTAITGGAISVETLSNLGQSSGIGQGQGGLVLDGGTLRYTGSGASTNRPFQVGTGIDGATGTIDASGTGALNFTFTGEVAYGVGNQQRILQLTGTNTDSNTFAGRILDNGGAFPSAPASLLKSGPGKWVLSGQSGYTGGTTISQGVLQISGAGTLGAATAANTVNIAAGASLVINKLNAYDLVNSIVGEGSVVIQPGSGLVSFGGQNTFSGGLLIGSGTVQLDPSSGTFGSGPITMADNSTLKFIRPIQTTALATSGTGSGASINGSSTLLISGTDTQTFAGNITGSISLTKTGPGTQYLNGANTYTGPTNINGGTLGGTGSISGPVFLNAGGSIAPGNSIGTFTLGLLDMSRAIAATGSGALEFELATSAASDKVNLSSGPLTIGNGLLEFGDFQFTVLAGFGPGTYTLFDGVTPIVGTLGSNTTGTLAGLDATLQFADGTSDLVLNVAAVPEPSTLVLARITIFIGCTFFWMERKRSQEPIS